MTIGEGLLTISAALITSLFGPTAVEWIKYKISKRKPVIDVVGEAINVNEKVDQQLEVIMNEMECDRICISQFHNGGHYFPTGKSIKKFSIFYEKITSNTPSIKETFQNIPVSLYPKIFSILYKEGEIVIPDSSNNDLDYGIFDNPGKKYNTKSLYIIAIKDINGNFIGTLTISYCDKKYKFNVSDWIYLREKIGAIGYMLTDYLNNDKK